MMKYFFKRKSIAAGVAVLVALVAAFFAVVFAASVPVLHEASLQNMPLRALVASQDTFHIPLKDSVVWLEMEKNTVHTICVDGSDKGLWKVKDFSYEKAGDCIQLKSGNYVKNGKIQYVTQIGHVVTFNLLVGMKYIDLSIEKHTLGSELHASHNRKGMPYYRDPVRTESIDKILIVDEYLVTNCEIVQVLWDSIPYYSLAKDPIPLKHHQYWIDKKKKMVRNDVCDAHDSAAIQVFLYDALIYANARSVQDGLTPVYSFKRVNGINYVGRLYEDGFDVYTTSFWGKYENSDDGWIRVGIDKDADGYRLPYYDEWMALARGGEKNIAWIWGRDNDYSVASQYAWFGDDSAISDKYGVYQQNSRPVGMKKPNAFGLYDMLGLVCENVMMPGKSRFGNEITSCKGGGLADSLDKLNFGSHKDNFIGGYGGYQGLRLVRVLR